MTLGDLQLSTGGSMQERQTCTTADGLDYYPASLSAGGGAEQRQLDWLRNRVAAVPDDGAKIVVEEMLPLGAPPPSSSPGQILQTYLSATGPRTVGWMSFYCEPFFSLHCLSR